jgi:Zn-finger nucleic acid-binding protein
VQSVALASKSRVLGGSFEMTNFSDIKNCPECGSLWHDKRIPEESRHHFGGSEWFSRVIGWCPKGYDRVTFYQCPDCYATWNRDTGTLEKLPSINS